MSRPFNGFSAPFAITDRLHTTGALSGDRGFSGLTQVEDQLDGVHDRLLVDLSYETEDGWMITAPAGFITDYASIPRLLWTVIPPHGPYNRPAIIHDYLYQLQPTDASTKQLVTQRRSDDILKEACGALNVRYTLRLSLWLGLRIGGRIAWNRYRNLGRLTS